jgi:hypothetical protein
MLLKRTGIADRIGILPACRAVRYSKAILARFCDELVSAPDIIWACFPSKHDNCSVEHERTEKPQQSEALRRVQSALFNRRGRPKHEISRSIMAGRLSKAKWAKLKRAFVFGHSLGAISEATRVSCGTLKAHASRHGWWRDRSPGTEILRKVKK